MILVAREKSACSVTLFGTEMTGIPARCAAVVPFWESSSTRHPDGDLPRFSAAFRNSCLLYTSDAAED